MRAVRVHRTGKGTAGQCQEQRGGEEGVVGEQEGPPPKLYLGAQFTHQNKKRTEPEALQRLGNDTVENSQAWAVEGLGLEKQPYRARVMGCSTSHFHLSEPCFSHL